ncbi:MAG TPA: S1/P1 nuclease [Salegentibacter sp.]|uniref:S1/P1 nuclease n=1 Tax=Salegentibacter sp. TaxID=1903072 RepID=UPI002F953366
MKRSILVLFAIFYTGIGFAENDWGKTGHRTTGEIAEKHLSKKAQKAISELLEGQSLAFVANYADDIKSDPDYRKYGPWHYVNIAPEDDKYVREKANKDGDLLQAIEKSIAVLKDKNASREDKKFYLKMLVHFMGDLHQPFHVGRGSDRGGNDIQVRWFNEGSNIHRVWDSQMIDSYQMSYSELAENRKELTRKELKEIEEGNLLDWVYESREMANRLYDSVEIGEKLGYEYMYKWFPRLREQLHKGGVRLAKVLNEIYR